MTNSEYEEKFIDCFDKESKLITAVTRDGKKIGISTCQIGNKKDLDLIIIPKASAIRLANWILENIKE